MVERLKNINFNFIIAMNFDINVTDVLLSTLADAVATRGAGEGGQRAGGGGE